MEILNLNDLWDGMLTELKNVLSTPIYTWLESSLLPLSYENDTLLLAASQNFIITYVKKNCLPQLNAAAHQLTGKRPKIEIILIPPTTEASEPEEKQTSVSEEIQPASAGAEMVQGQLGDFVAGTLADKTEQAPAPLAVKEAQSVAPPPEDGDAENNLTANYTFENFIVGNSNRIAYSIATSVAEAPAQKYNPLYIYGGSGLGKTHLMHAIGHQILKKFPYMRLRCITSEDFVNDFIQAIQDKNTENFRQQYRNIDVLLVDDIQFLGQGEKDSSKEEFFHTFNKLYQGQKQMVFTSDRPPQDIKSLEDRLRSRFQSGMVTEIAPPDLETRTAILRTWAQKEKIKIDTEAINYIAANVSENIRDLNGAFNKVLSLASIDGTNVTLNLTQQALKYLINKKEEKKYVTIDEIIHFTCDFYHISSNELMGKKRTKNIALPRQVAMYLCRELTGNTYPHIGMAFNGRDHTTVMHACEKITNMMKKNDRFKEIVDGLKKRIIGVDK